MAAIGTALAARGGKGSLFSWPPAEDAVVKYGPRVVLGLAVASASTVLATTFLKEESHTPEVLKVRSRTAVLRSRGHADGAKAEAGNEKLDDESQDKEWHEQETQVRKPKLQDLMSLARKGLESEAGSAVKFKELFAACIDLRHLDTSDPDLAKGFYLAAAVLVNELKRHSRLTLEGQSAVHKTGEDLADLISQYSTLHAMCRGLNADEKQKAELWNKVRELWWESWNAQLVLWRLRIPDVIKALKVVLLAKRCLPMLLFASCCKIGANSVEAVAWLYAAEALELLRVKGFTRNQLLGTLWAETIASLSTMLLNLVGDRLSHCAFMRGAHLLRTQVYAAMLRQDMEWYRLGQHDQRDVHGLFNQIFHLPNMVKNFYDAVARIFEASFSCLSYGKLIQERADGMLQTHVPLMLVTSFAMSGAENLFNWVREVITRTMTKVELNWIEPLMPENISTVRACAAEGKVLQNWNMFFRTEHEKEWRRDLVKQAQSIVSAGIDFTQWGAFVLLASKLSKENRITHVAEVGSLLLLVQRFSKLLVDAVKVIASIKNTIPDIARTYDVVFTEPSIGMEKGIVPAFPRAQGRVEFKNVSFQYPGTGEVLTDISFDLPVKHSCGITGSTGAGKSTVLQLLQRFYDPKEGAIFLDGMDIRTLNPIWVRRQIAVVSQRPRIFHSSLLQNLTYGCDIEPPEEEVQAACKAACMFDLVFQNPVRFPLGLHTRVSNETLSGGELQRVAIARALLKDSPILLLDEATSALDSESQSQVKEGLKRLMEGRTILTVAHRLETIKDADSILCLEEGRVCEHGTHAELVQAGGLYSRLYREQIESTISGQTNGPQDPALEAPVKGEVDADSQ